MRKNFSEKSSQRSANFQKGNVRNHPHKNIRVRTLQKEPSLSALSPSKLNPQKSSLIKKKSVSSVIRLNTLQPIQSIETMLIKKRLNYNFSNEEKKNGKYKGIYQSRESPIKIQPFKQYQSRLKLSAESWVIYDMKEQRYKRGWKPNKVSDFNGLLRIFVLMIYCRILNRNKSDFNHIKIKVNPECLMETKFQLSKKQQKRLKWIKESKQTVKILSKGSIISLSDLVQGMIASGSQDLFEYALMVCGYLLYCEENCLKIQPETSYITIKSSEGDQIFAEYFLKEVECICEKMHLKDTEGCIQELFYELKSTPNEICAIFLEGLKEPKFRQIIQLEKVTSAIKFQVGYNFWEDRIITIRNKILLNQNPGHFCKVVFRGSKSHEAVCYNKHLKILMIIQDSKFSMADLDIQVLQNWYRNATKYLPSKEHQNSPIRINKKHSILPLILLTNQK